MINYGWMKDEMGNDKSGAENTWQGSLQCEALVSPASEHRALICVFVVFLPRTAPPSIALALGLISPLARFHFTLIAAMALQLLCASYLPTFSGLKAAPSVRQDNKLSGLGCVRRSSASQSIKAILNPMDDPILKEAMKEPIAFLGGVFAGLLRLDLNEEPLKDWVAKTAEAAGIDLYDSQAADADDSVPEDIRID